MCSLYTCAIVTYDKLLLTYLNVQINVSASRSQYSEDIVIYTVSRLTSKSHWQLFQPELEPDIRYIPT